MAGLQFIPTASANIKIDVAETGNTHISVPIEHINNHKRCQVLETEEFIDSLDGILYIYIYDEKSEDDKAKLKNEGYIGYLSYSEGVESGAFIIQTHVTQKEFNRIENILSNGNNLTHINIETPLHGKSLRYGTTPDDPIVWSIKENNWVYLEQCDINIEFTKNEKH